MAAPAQEKKNYDINNLSDCLDLMEIFFNKANKAGVFLIEEAAVIAAVVKQIRSAVKPAQPAQPAQSVQESREPRPKPPREPSKIEVMEPHNVLPNPAMSKEQLLKALSELNNKN